LALATGKEEETRHGDADGKTMNKIAIVGPISISVLVVTALTVGALHAQAPTGSSLVRLDPAMDDYDNVIPPVPPRGGFDGIKVDTQGNVWGEGPGGIWIVSPAGKALGSILIPEPPANLAFGEADGKTLFITARRGLYRIRINVAGILPGPK
jgi:hypothetical protein